MLAQSMSVSIRAHFNVGVIKILLKAVERVKAKYLEIELFRSELMMKSTLLPARFYRNLDLPRPADKISIGVV